MKKDYNVSDLIQKKIKDAPGKAWLNTFFDLQKMVLEFSKLNSNDARLVMSISSDNNSWQFPLTINNRYIIAR